MSSNVHCQSLNKLQSVTFPFNMGGMSYVAKAVKEARIKAGYSQATLAGLLGMTQDNYNKLETGKRNFSDAMILKVVSVEQLGLDLPTLQGFKAIDEYGTDGIMNALKALPVKQKMRLKQELEAIEE